MKLILTAAGKYERFRRFSYEIPKYLLPVKNRTLLHHVLKGFGKMDTIFVGNKQDSRFANTVDCILYEHCNTFQTKWIGDTSGQAETLMRATEGLDGPFVVHNIDTILLSRYWPIDLMGADCVIDVFESSNRDYSYVIDQDGYAKEIREKQVISNKASSGCYMFKGRSVIEPYFDQNTRYISEMINKLIKDEGEVLVTRTHKASDTLVLGTPEEYLINMDSDKLRIA
jgi:NDP-sugar pyrophosphorylase family protein